MTDTEARSEDTDMGRGHQNESGVRVKCGGEGRKLAQVVAATLLDYLCAFSRLQTVRDYMRIVFCLAAQRRLLSAAALELHDDQFDRRREEREEGSEDHWAAVELRAKLLLLLLSILTY